MSRPDLILIHPPSTLMFREDPSFYGPVSDVVPSTSVFEIYPIGFLTMSEYLCRHGIAVRIINLALKMLKDRSLNPEHFIKKLDTLAFGIDLHWLPHVDGCLGLAELIKKCHPGKPIILGGLSATYYHREIMREYPFIDFIVRGDSTEVPLRMLMEAIRSQSGYAMIPNIVWKDVNGCVVVNEMTHKPANLDHLRFDYAHVLRQALKYRDIIGYIPFKRWTTYPVSAVFQCRGCSHNCASCAGSLSSFKDQCNREGPCFRSPALLAEDIKRISAFTGAPIMVIGDLLQAGHDYANQFLHAMKHFRITNEIAIEFFTPPPESFVRKVSDSMEQYNVEISPESHDQRIRKAFGKWYNNQELEGAIESFIRNGCNRIDLFFMIGLPFQDYTSVMNTIAYCERLLEEYGPSGRLLPMISPLAPFIDPGSRIFENPKKFGYKLRFKTLREHREAMLKPSWKDTLNYETAWMTRDDIVQATYDAALRLIELKVRFGLIGSRKARALITHIKRAKKLMLDLGQHKELYESVKEEIRVLNNVDTICNKHELEWPLRGWRLNARNIFHIIFDIFHEEKKSEVLPITVISHNYGNKRSAQSQSVQHVIPISRKKAGMFRHDNQKREIVDTRVKEG